MKFNVKCTYCDTEIKRSKTKTDCYFCNIGCKSLWQKKQRENLGFTKEWLIDQYFNKGKTCNDIAKEIGRNSKRVWEWFKDYDIKIQSRGENKNQQFKKGHKAGVGRVHTDETKRKIRDARIKDGHVPYLNKEGVHWLKGVKGFLHPSFRGGLTPERQSFYSSEEWCEAVKQVWKRDNAICQKCGKSHNTEQNRGNFHIHHIISFQVKEFRSNIDNLLLLCKDCHRWVHSKSNINNQFIKKWNH